MKNREKDLNKSYISNLVDNRKNKKCSNSQIMHVSY
jgi:hypothetical protein